MLQLSMQEFFSIPKNFATQDNRPPSGHLYVIPLNLTPQFYLYLKYFPDLGLRNSCTLWLVLLTSYFCNQIIFLCKANSLLSIWWLYFIKVNFCKFESTLKHYFWKHYKFKLYTIILLLQFEQKALIYQTFNDVALFVKKSPALL